LVEEDYSLEKLEKREIKTAARVFVRAMNTDPLLGYFFPDHKIRFQKLMLLYTYILKIQFDNVSKTSPKIEGLIIWEKPFEHHSSISIKNIVLGLNLVFKLGFGSLIKMVKYYTWAVKIRNRYIDDPYWYLDVIVVDPLYQGRGFASTLIRPILEIAGKKKEKIYLETQNKDNITIYQKYGFRLVQRFVISGTNLDHFVMIKEL